MFGEIFFCFFERFEDGGIGADSEFFRGDFESEIPFVSAIMEFDEEAFERHISFAGEKFLFVSGFIGEIDIVDTVPENTECLDKINPTLRIDIGDMEGSLTSDLFDGLEGRIFVFWNEKKKSFRFDINDRDIDIFVTLFDFWEMATEPFTIFIQSVWWIEIHNLGIKDFCHFHNRINYLLAHFPLISSNTYNGNLELFGERCYIFRIFGIEIQRIEIQIDTIVPRFFRKRKNLMESVSAERCCRKEKHKDKL